MKRNRKPKLKLNPTSKEITDTRHTDYKGQEKFISQLRSRTFGYLSSRPPQTVMALNLRAWEILPFPFVFILLYK
jgi:hypothetical protein